VGSLDPLGANAACAAVPSMNANADTTALVAALRQLLPDEADIAHFSVAECLAAMRDIGLLIGSIKRHGAEPLVVLPQTERVLIKLGNRTHMVPRDTVYHYGPWNALGVQQRMYTASPEEGVLIRSVRMALPAVESAVRVLTSLRAWEPADQEFASGCAQVADMLEAMVDAIDLVRRHVTPDFFARQLRPYFEEVRVGGVAYFGPAAAHIPLYLVDQLLWSADHPDSVQHEFQRETMAYSPDHWRWLFKVHAGQRSIDHRVVDALVAGGADVSAPLSASAESLCRVVRVLVTFRGRHLALARAAYQVDRRLYAAGSGGATVDLLARIVQLTRCYAGSLRPYLSRTSPVEDVP